MQCLSVAYVGQLPSFSLPATSAYLVRLAFAPRIPLRFVCFLARCLLLAPRFFPRFPSTLVSHRCFVLLVHGTVRLHAPPRGFSSSHAVRTPISFFPSFLLPPMLPFHVHTCDFGHRSAILAPPLVSHRCAHPSIPLRFSRHLSSLPLHFFISCFTLFFKSFFCSKTKARGSEREREVVAHAWWKRTRWPRRRSK